MRADIAWPGWVDKRTAKSLYAGENFVTLQAFIKASGQVEAARLARPEPIPTKTCVLCKATHGHTPLCGSGMPGGLLSVLVSTSDRGLSSTATAIEIVEWIKGRM